MPPFLSLQEAQLPADKELHLAIGMFDGVHLGHQAVIETAIHSARRTGGIAAVLTFSPHPSHLFRPEAPVLQILTKDQKSKALYDLGIDALLIRLFEPNFAAIPATDFLPHLKNELPGLHALYIGEHFRFGKGRSGDVPLLIESGKTLKINTFSIPQLHYNGETISSTRIRAALTTGDITLANDLLGRSYTPEGTVTEGAKRGRTLGFPTLNLPWEAELKPQYGVYAVQVRKTTTDKSQATPWEAAVANFGLRPTVGDLKEPLLEVHVLNPTALTYGDRVEVAFHNFLRPEAKFTSLETLKKAIAHDAARAKAFFI